MVRVLTVTEKTCTKCGETKSAEAFGKYRAGLRAYCKSCHAADQRERYRQDPSKQREATRRWRETHREQYTEQRRRHEKRRQGVCNATRQHRVSYRARLRAQVLEAYGGRCVCCDETTPEFLGVDHVHNDGAQHRREVGGSGVNVYSWLRANGFPKDRFQLLCHNCNLAKGFYGECPHKRSGQQTERAA